ncbi:hypothetical protein M406DRAFT_356621, partial [Cryphonectria parasitica EP155]
MPGFLPPFKEWMKSSLVCGARDSSVIGGVITLTLFIDAYHLGTPNSLVEQNLSANIISTLQAVCFVGALAASPLTDRCGRKWLLVASTILIIIGVILQA